MMKRQVSVGVATVLAIGCMSSGSQADGQDLNSAGEPGAQSQPNTLSASERDQGWDLLFDGTSLAGWRGFRTDHAPDSWKVVDGTIYFSPDSGRGDIITDRQFENFELMLEWKISPAGNSGIFYRVTEEADRIWEVAPEIQVLDNGGHPDSQYSTHTAGANYDLHAPSADVTKPVGGWNAVRLIVNGNHVEHWLNGTKIVEYEFGSPEWTSLVAVSKFNEWPAYGMSKRGRIGLQDHGNPVWYRNIKVRELSSSS